MRRLAGLLLLLLCFGCDQKKDSASLASASAAPPGHDFSRMTAKERLAVANEPCYTDESCSPERTARLLGSAGEGEQAALMTAVQHAIAAQVQTHLAKKHGTVVRVTVNDGVLTISGSCTRFVLENFLATPGKHAARAGLTRVKCESNAMKAEAVIP
ncbi:MAG: hypothetical protein R3B13_11275 [Polyangiaceae bacterium]